MNFSDVVDMDMEFVRPYRQVHLVVCMCHDHSVRFGWARIGIGRYYPLARLDHMPFERFVGGWAVPHVVIKIKSWTSNTIASFDGFEPLVTGSKSRRSMKVTYQGLSAGYIVGAAGLRRRCGSIL